RLWDVEIFVREALATTAAVLLGGMTFVLLNALLDRTLEGMAEAGKNVVAFGSGLVLAALLVPMKRRITGVLEKIQYHDTYRARPPLLRGRIAAPRGHGPGGPRLRERSPLRSARRTAGGDSESPAVPGERHPLLVLGDRGDRPGWPPPVGQSRPGGDRRASRS